MLPEMENSLREKILPKKPQMKKENMAEFRILDRRQLSDDQMVVTIYMARKDAERQSRRQSGQNCFSKNWRRMESDKQTCAGELMRHLRVS